MSERSPGPEYIVTIADNATCKQVTYSDRFYADTDDLVAYMWEDGNYSCNCNRALYMSRHSPDVEEEDWDAECGDDAFSVKIVRADTMRVIYADGAFASTAPEVHN